MASANTSSERRSTVKSDIFAPKLDNIEKFHYDTESILVFERDKTDLEDDRKTEATRAVAEENRLPKSEFNVSAEFYVEAVASLAPPAMRDTVAEGARAFLKAVETGDEQMITDLIARATGKTTARAKPAALQPHALPAGAPVPVPPSFRRVADLTPSELLQRRAKGAAKTAAYRERQKKRKYDLGHL